MNINYIYKILDFLIFFAGKNNIDNKVTLKKLKNIFGIISILMEWSPILNGTFLRENLFDELVLYFSPIIGGKDDKNLYENGVVKTLSLESTFINKDGTLLLYEI
jgi:riboflavin biosynthesis pyrimidine reductase